MKKKLLLLSPCRTAARALLLGVGLLAAASVTAQNFVKNPDFEDPLGPDNWTVVYTNTFGGGANQPTNCGPFDFLFAGRSTIAHKDMNPGTWDGEDRTGTNYWSKFGGHFAPNHTWMMHAYFKQVVKGLTPGGYYTVSAWMGFFGGNDSYLNKCNIYLEAVGLLGSKTTPYPTANVLDVQNHPENWLRYTVTNRATSAGEIEVRLHFNKFGTTSTWEYRNFNAFYDHVAVEPVAPATPPTLDLVVSVTNLTATFKWNTLAYSTYDLEISTDYGPWSRLATGLRATGPTLTYIAQLPTAPRSMLSRVIPHTYVPSNLPEFLPVYRTVSIARSNRDIALTWESVPNNRYRLQVSQNLQNPASWSWVTWSPKLDTNLYATGTFLTFKTNLDCLFASDPSVDLTKPLFFRVFSRSYEP